jgi:hypothetical protein
MVARGYFKSSRRSGTTLRDRVARTGWVTGRRS